MTTARAGRLKEVGNSTIPLSSGGRTIHPCREIDYTPRSARATSVLTEFEEMARRTRNF